MNTLILYTAAPDYARYYCPDDLSATDQKRLQSYPHWAQKTDWQVSRAIKAQAKREGYEQGVLSHRQGHAVFVPTAPDERIGVDCEWIQERAFDSWHGLVITELEQSWLKQRGQHINDYYALWTLKEALVKACGGEWADLASVGLCQQHTQWQLYAMGQTDWWGQVWQCDHFMFACVHRSPKRHYQWRGLGQWANRLPMLYYHIAPCKSAA